MHRIERIEIVGFRGAGPIKLAFSADVNFIIGRNGTGKTSLINLISAAVTVDREFLARASFETVKVVLRKDGSRTRPSITVRKRIDDDGDVILQYDIQESASGTAETTDIIVSNERRLPRSWARTRYLHLHPWEDFEDPQARVASAISQLVVVTWLSILRSPKRAAEGDEKFESHIDRKLYQVAVDFSAYFSTLDKQAAQASDKFQQSYLLSLISPPKFNFASLAIKNIEPGTERSAIKEMFQEFNLKPTAFERKLDTYIKRMSSATNNYKPNTSVVADDFLVLTDTLRIHDLVVEWNALNEERDRIYKPKTDFVDIINKLMYKKSVSISAANRPVFLNDNGDEIPMMSLSSGEKQLFIILGESLLQRGMQCVFMADEPEISLHVAWQERLVPSLRQINPNAQVIFATHSPDIVGSFDDKTIDLEKVLA